MCDKYCILFNKEFKGGFTSNYFKTYNKAKDIIMHNKPLKIEKGIIPIEVLEGFSL